MNYCTHLFLWFFHIFINTKCEHYTSYEFEWNNPQQWSTNDQSIEIISCTIDIPSLCVYAFPPYPGFHIFYKHSMFDFLSDSNWTQVIVTNNFDNEEYNQIMLSLLNATQSTPHRRRIIHLTPCFTERCKARRAAKKRDRRRCGTGCKMRAAGSAFHLLRNGLRYLKERKERKRVYNKLYRFGRKLGRAMKSGNFAPLCGLTGGCPLGYGRRRRGCGGYGRRRCPMRFMSYLGRPHVVGRPQYIVGTPPVGDAPMGYGMSQSFAMGMGMHPGMMGGMHQGMMGGGMMSGMPMILGPGANGAMGGHRRLIHDENGNDIRLKKCVLIASDQEICCIFYYLNGMLRLEYNKMIDGKEMRKDIGNKYIKGNVWILREGDLYNKECNDNILQFIGYTVCVQRNDAEMYVWIMEDIEDPSMEAINVMDEKKWDKIYFINNGNARKICRDVLMIEICFEIENNHKMVEITTERVLPLENIFV